MNLQTNGISLEYELAGPADGPPLVLITGLGSQLVHWADELITGFAAAGFRVVTFDNRDTGRSDRVPGRGQPLSPADLRRALDAGRPPEAPYLLTDMADDVAGLIAGLGFDKAHVFGISMGGMVLQQLMISHPGRLRAAVIVMSTAEPARIGSIGQLVLDPLGRDDYITEAVSGFEAWGSPGFPAPAGYFSAKAARAFDRGHSADGVNRQLLAVANSPDRRDELRQSRVPTLVIHGAQDALIGPDHGRALAALITGAELEIIEGMGHTIPPLLAPLIVARTVPFLKSATD